MCTGPLSRRAEDLYPLLRILVGDDPKSAKLRDPAGVDIRSLRVFSIEGDGVRAVDPELLSAQERAAQILEKQGATVKRAKLDGLARAPEIWGSMIGEGGGPTFAELLGEGKPVSGGRELVKWMAGRSPHTFPAIALVLLERLQQLVGPEQARRFIDLGRRLEAEVLELLGSDGVFLYPPHPLPAPRHGEPLTRPFRWVYTGIFNVLKLPVTAVPMGLSRGGLPLGVQVGAHPGNDHLSLAVAMLLEREAGGWIPPPISRLG